MQGATVNEIWQDVKSIQERAPLVHNITNYVVMNSTANALLAVGASPVMAHAEEEVEEMANLAQAVVLNIGTLSEPWVRAMVRAGVVARSRGIPLVLDPVGAGATRLRTNTARRLLEACAPTIVRGNASEIQALGSGGGATKGVDSTEAPEQALEAALSLSQTYGCVVSMSGPIDLIIHGEKVARVANGHPMMTRVTGMGCTASALTGAFAAVNPNAFLAACHAMVFTGVVGEMVAEHAAGTGSFQVAFLDTLGSVSAEELARRARLS
jgi:hydroxyethylthiazole kinase